MSIDPLHTEPLRPELNDLGRLANPIGHQANPLDAHTPLFYDDLEATATYADTRFEYLTDQDAMPARVRGVLELTTGPKVRRHRGPQSAVGRFGDAGGRWHGGHIVAVSLGGFASGPNLFPQSANFNQAAYTRLENGWREALREGLSVGIDIALTEGSDPRVPEFVMVTYWEDDELMGTIPLINGPHAQ